MLFRSPQKYTVTSEDGKWSAVYTVEFVKSELPTNYHFETLTESSANKYDIFYEFQEGTSTEPSKIVQWASGNIGYDLTGMAKESNDYPTVQVNDGKIGKCLKLETKNTGRVYRTDSSHTGKISVSGGSKRQRDYRLCICRSFLWAGCI